MSSTNRQTLALCLGLALVVLAAYANHFENDFHFDDMQTVVANVYIRSLANIPRFFRDAGFSAVAGNFSAVPGSQIWQPVVTASLAIDYFVGGGLKPFFFHFSTFAWFLLQLLLMFLLFRRIMDAADPHPSNTWTALLATACYGLHPANAETVNYIIQRGDLYNTLGVVASLLWFAAYPAERKRGWYLIPALAAYLSKAPALVFPLILLAYVFLFEQDRKWRPALLAAAPALLVTAAAAILIKAMTPAYDPGVTSAALYRLTQPWIALRYFRCFFLPTDLSADTDLGYVTSAFSVEAQEGYLFVAGLIAAVVFTSRRPATRPVAFGLTWFLLALAPTSLFPSAQVTNDHRMFFPFVGLALAVGWSLRLVLFRKTAQLTANPAWLRVSLIAVAAVLLAAAVGTWERNEVWRTEETLWRDVTVKSPNNGRGLFNYANRLLARGDFAGGVPYLERAQALQPTDPAVEVRLAIGYAGLRQDAQANRHFENAVGLAPSSWQPHFYYGRWLHEKGKMDEAQNELIAAVRASPQSLAARYLLMQLFAEQRNWTVLDALVADTVQLAKGDEVAHGYSAEATRRAFGQAPSPEALVGIAAVACGAGRYDECLMRARQALNSRPNYAEAYYVASGALIARRRKSDAARALRTAMRIKPDYEAARQALITVE